MARRFHRALFASLQKYFTKKNARGYQFTVTRTNRDIVSGSSVCLSLQAPRGRFKDLFCREYLFTTIGLWLLWFGTAFSYYGMVLAQSEILEFHKTCASGMFGGHKLLI